MAPHLMPEELETLQHPLSENVLPRGVLSHAEDPIDINHQSLCMIRPVVAECVTLSHTKNGGVRPFLDYLLRGELHLHRWGRHHYCLLL
jgi:hypothetical protein